MNTSYTGYIFQTNGGFTDRYGNNINVQVINNTEYKFNLNLAKLLDYSQTLDLKKSASKNKVFFMTDKSYCKLKANNLVVEIGNDEYYRLFENELWLIHKF